jgi:hypothetical protein
MKAANVEKYRKPILLLMGLSFLSLVQLSGAAFWVSTFVLASCSVGAFFTYWLARCAIYSLFLISLRN